MRLNQHKSHILFLLMEEQYRDKINYKNINIIPWYKIYFILKNETHRDREMFLHNLVDKWIVNSKLDDERLFINIKRIIRKTRIRLNDIELSQLFTLEERAFSIDRHIKIINSNIKLSKRESIGVKFTNAILFREKNMEKISKGDLLVSNKRIIVIGSDIELSFPFSKIESYEYKEYGFLFISNNNEKYLLRIHDQITLNNTICNIIQKKVKYAIKKRKNNQS
ncbi:hypothetical protein [Candidatus Mycoplasma mahonii]|uniref:hypothetical protein n=1 Tax=Candidatus Mycoplasma mahonii TaxID=3004105 RepID=UPI0026EE6A29|nr:hypothetical protein [Candidatus Mycoplasma mahonii]WKX02554.1 hypothetical protein O3I44_00535 [Candidatus Mycoplasma mahonii]